MGGVEETALEVLQDIDLGCWRPDAIDCSKKRVTEECVRMIDSNERS